MDQWNFTATCSRQNLTGCNRAKQERIAHGSGETMRKPGEEGAPTAGAFKQVEGTGKANPAEKPKRKSRAS